MDKRCERLKKKYSGVTECDKIFEDFSRRGVVTVISEDRGYIRKILQHVFHETKVKRGYLSI